MSPDAQQIAIAVGTNVAVKVLGSLCSRRCRDIAAEAEQAKWTSEDTVDVSGLAFGVEGPERKDGADIAPAAAQSSD